MKIVSEVQVEINSNSIVKNCVINVGYMDGTIILEGDVCSYYQKQMAQEVARKVIGKGALALGVRNDLRVKQPYTS